MSYVAPVSIAIDSGTVSVIFVRFGQTKSLSYVAPVSIAIDVIKSDLKHWLPEVAFVCIERKPS